MARTLTIADALREAYERLRVGDLAEAQRICAQVLRQAPRAGPALKLLGIIAVRRGDSDGVAMRCFEAARAAAPDDPETHGHLASARLSAGRSEGALVSAREATRLAPREARWWRSAGEAAMALERWDEARTCLERARELDPGDVDGAAARAILANSTGDFDTAERLLDALPYAADRQRDEVQYLRRRHLADARSNQRCAAERLLILRHPRVSPDFYQVLLDWVVLNFPACRRYFELRLLPCRIDPTEGYHGLHCWLQDPVQAWSTATYAQALAITEQFRERGLPVLNGVDRLAHAGKAEGGRRMREAGLPVPHASPVDDIASFQGRAPEHAYPLLLREDWGHGGPILRFDHATALAATPAQDLLRLQRPIAVPFVDVASPHGTYRKYRYVAMGSRGLPHHAMTTSHWVTRGNDRIVDERVKALELDYTRRPDPLAPRFEAARQALGLDLVAFDYSYARDGSLVVWEANPYPYFRFPSTGGAGHFRIPAMHRTLALLLAGYLDTLGVALPERLAEVLALGDPASERVVSALASPRDHAVEDGAAAP